MKKFIKYIIGVLAIPVLLAQSGIAQQSLNGIRLQDPNGHVVTIGAPAGGFTGNYNFRFPAALPAAGALLYSSDGMGQSSWLPAGSNGQVLSYSAGLPVWSTLSSLLSGLVEWDLSGNAVLLSYNGLLGSFLGTTNNQPLVLATTNILTPQPIEFFTNNAEKMRLTSSGELGIGLTPAAGKLLHVAGTAGTSNVRLASLASATGSTGRVMFATDAAGDLGSLAFPASGGQVLTSSTTGALSWTTPTTGTVTSVGVTVPSILSVAPATITTSGTFAITLANQSTGNQIFASPNGASGTPTFRSMVLADMPQVASNTILGNNTAGTAAPNALTTAQVKTLLNLTGTNSGDVTLAGTGTYLSLSGQAITQNPIDLSSVNATGTLAAARFPALTGDVTSVAGSLATTIANNAVTYGKLQNTTAASVLLGRNSTGAGAIGEITLGAGLSMSAGGVLSASGFMSNALTANHIFVGSAGGTATDVAMSGDVNIVSSGATTIQPAAVSLSKMANLAANSIIGNNTGAAATPIALTTAQVKTMLNLTGTNSGDVTLSGENYLSLSGQAITANPINLSGTNVTGTLAAARFPALTGDVTTVSGALGTTIANSAVTYAKMQNTSAASVLLGRGSAAGAGALQEITLGAGLTLTGQVLSTSAASAVAYNPGAQQATATNTGSNYLFDIAYAPGAVAQSDLGAKITSTNTSAGINNNATALTLNATATSGGTATGLVINTSGGAAQPHIFLGGSASGIITTNLPEVYYEETGDTYGTSRLRMQHRTGSNGALFETISNAGHPGTDLVDFGFKPGSGVQSNLRLEARSSFQRSALNISSSFPEEFQFFFGTTQGSPVNVFSVGQSATLLETGNFGIGYAAAPGTPAGNPLEKLDVHTAAGTPANIILSNAGTSFTNGTPGLLKFQGTRDGVTSFQAGAQGSTNINYTLPVTVPSANQVLTATGVAAPSVTLGWQTALTIPMSNSTSSASTLIDLTNSGSGDVILGTASGASSQGSFGVKGVTSATAASASTEVMGVWGLASSTNSNSVATTGVRAEGNATTTDSKSNIALEVLNGEFVVARQASSSANDNSNGNNILVSGEDDAAGLTDQGPSGVVDVTDGGNPAGNNFTTGSLQVYNRYASSHSIILLTPLPGGSGAEGSGESNEYSITSRANGNFTIQIRRTRSGGGSGTSGTWRVGFLIVNPGK